jgi:hypothetical protein
MRSDIERPLLPSEEWPRGLGAERGNAQTSASCEAAPAPRSVPSVATELIEELKKKTQQPPPPPPGGI